MRERWDGLGQSRAFEIDEKRASSGVEDCFSANCARRCGWPLANIRQFCEWQKPKEWTRRPGWNLARAIGAAAGFGGMLCSRRAASAGFDGADDGDSGAGRGCKEYSRGFAAACRPKFWRPPECWA